MDDLISKYARKKPAPPPPPPAVQRDYSSTSLKYGASRENIYGTNRDSLYGLYGGASSTSLYVPASRRSSQYEVPSYAPPEPPIYDHAHQRQTRYISASKSSSNLYLQSQYGGGPGFVDTSRSLNRQQKTLSMHGAPTSGRNNSVMEAAASIINAHHGLGTASDWWSSSNQHAGQPAPLQHDWSQKNNLWTAAGSGGVGGGTLGMGGVAAPGIHHHPVLPVQSSIFFPIPLS